jgi:hypothetical protein
MEIILPPEFQSFKKIPRLYKDMTISEKLDGSNLCIHIDESNTVYVGSHNRWLWNSKQEEIHNDNFGSARWVKEHLDEVKQLGVGWHYSEIMGLGIQRTYGLNERRVYLFNANRWCMHNEEPKLISKDQKTGIEKYQSKAPSCFHVVPVLYQGIFSESKITECLETLKTNGSVAVPGYCKPEGVCIYLHAAGQYFKLTIDNPEGKWKSKEV